jgi:hypothetical protein
MKKEIIEQRIKELKEALDRSAAQHNAIVGRLAEAEEILKMIIEGKDNPDIAQT